MPSDGARLPSRQLAELISKALLDEDLRQRLFADPEGVAQAFALTQQETQALGRLDRRRLEQWVTHLRSA